MLVDQRRGARENTARGCEVDRVGGDLHAGASIAVDPAGNPSTGELVWIDNCYGDTYSTLPVGGVQFHPESLMSLGGEVGLRIVENAFRLGATN